MTLADAIQALAVAGCRLTPGEDGGITLVVPEGTVVDRRALDALRAHREELTALVPAKPKPKADDLAGYLTEKRIVGTTAELVLQAARTFNVATDRITVEGEITADAPPAFFEPGIPAITVAETAAVARRGGCPTILPAGLLGLLVPQVWAIHDQRLRAEVESVHHVLRRQGRPPHVPFWHGGDVHLVDTRSITFEGAVAPDGMNLLPWRPLTPEGLRS